MTQSPFVEPLTAREITLCRVALIARMSSLMLNNPAHYDAIKQECNILLEKLWNQRRTL